MSGFTKLHSSILDSTVWDLPIATRIVWITMLAMADRDGWIAASVPGLAKRAGVTRDECEAALSAFLGPDPDSRSQEYEGRRIAKVDGGWSLLNYAKYRALLNKDDIREKTARRVKAFRERKAVTPKTLQNVAVTRRNESNDIAEAEANSEADADPHPRVRAHARARFETPPIPEQPPELADRKPLVGVVRDEHESRYAALSGDARPVFDFRSARTLADWCEANAGAYRRSPEALVTSVLEGLFRSPGASEKRWKLSWAAKDPEEFCGAPEGSRRVSAQPDKHAGPSVVAARHEYAVVGAKW